MQDLGIMKANKEKPLKKRFPHNMSLLTKVRGKVKKGMTLKNLLTYVIISFCDCL